MKIAGDFSNCEALIHSLRNSLKFIYKLFCTCLFICKSANSPSLMIFNISLALPAHDSYMYVA